MGHSFGMTAIPLLPYLKGGSSGQEHNMLPASKFVSIPSCKIALYPVSTLAGYMATVILRQKYTEATEGVAFAIPLCKAVPDAVSCWKQSTAKCLYNELHRIAKKCVQHWSLCCNGIALVQWMMSLWRLKIFFPRTSLQSHYLYYVLMQHPRFQFCVSVMICTDAISHSTFNFSFVNLLFSPRMKFRRFILETWGFRKYEF